MTDEGKKIAPDDAMLKLVCEIVSAYVGANQIPSDQIGSLITNIHAALATLGARESVQQVEAPRPAVAIRKSISDDYIVCLEDGKKLKMLKRYLRSRYGMSPSDYRAKWGLPPDYPMVAPNYAAQRSAFAKQIGLGKDGRRSRD